MDRMRRTAGKKNRNRNSGSALVIAIVIMMIVMMLSLALLLVSFSLSSTASSQIGAEQCKEIAQGVSRAVQAEITGNDVDFDTAEQMEAALNTGKNPFWSYLRCNLWQNNWPYYNASESGHGPEQAWREFTLSAGAVEGADILDNVSVEVYWASQQGAERTENTSVFVRVTCEIRKQKSVITTEYDLTVEENPADYGEGNSICPAGACNPAGNIIQTGEKWSFSFAGRE